jgi:hypothetical protein
VHSRPGGSTAGRWAHIGNNMALSYILTHGIVYFVIVDGYLLLLMISLSPRIWGYADYPEKIKEKVPPQTKNEKFIATIVAIPWMVFTFGFPIYSVIQLKGYLGLEFTFWTALVDVIFMVLLVNVGDVLILDLIIVNKITPKLVIIPGTEKNDYKDFSHHYKGRIKALVIQLIICIILAIIVSLL